MGFMNLYHSGFYHRRDKPDGNVNVHGGDMYLTRAEAVNAIEPRAGYITTIKFEANLPMQVQPNGSDLTAMPIRESRGLMSEGAAAWLAS